MAKKNRLLWKFYDTESDGRRHMVPASTFQKGKPPESRVAKGEPRAYGDFRDYEAEGGTIEALRPEGQRSATSDAEIAEKLVSDRLDELKEARRTRVETGVRRTWGLKEFASFHLRKKAQNDVSESWVVAVEGHMRRAVAFFGKDRELSTIRPSHVREWIEELRETPNGRGRRCPECEELGDLVDGGPDVECPECRHTWRGGTLSEKTVRDHLNSLSNLFKRARSEEAVPSGFSPVRDTMEKPSGGRTQEADYFEPHEAALLLEAARTWKPEETGGAPNCTFAYPLLATVLLTGGRKAEVLGLQVEDVDLENRMVIHFRPNEHRDLKTESSHRTVPVWPQLREVLGAYLESDESPDSGLLFPSPRTGKMISDFRKSLDPIGERCGFQEGEVRFHKLRHTYTAARIQTTEAGHPVALYTVARELGHRSTKLIEDRYGHLTTNRKTRGEEVAFRPETYEEEIGERLHELQVVA